MIGGWLAIAAVCALVYGNSLSNGFHYDDEHSIQLNIHIRSLANLPAFFVDPARFSVDADKAMYRPVLLVTYALNHALGGESVTGYRVVNVLIHGLNACLVAWLALLLGGRPPVAVLAGLLFAVHPLATEPANYISSRSESLASLFYLLGLALFVRSRTPGAWQTQAAVGAALAAGLLSKETAITLPALLLVHDLLVRSGRRGLRWREAASRHAPYWLITGGFLLLISANRFLPRSLERPVRSATAQALTQLKGLAHYLYRIAWPAGLTVEPQFLEQRAALAPVVVACALLAATGLWLACRLYRGRRDLPLFVLVWGVLALLPVLVMPLNVLVNERRLYLSAAAACVGLAGTFHRGLLDRLRVGAWSAGQAAAAALLVVFGVLVWQRNQVWRSEFTLWQDAVSKAPLMPRTHLYLGNALKDSASVQPDWEHARPLWQAALDEYKQAVKLGGKGELAVRALNNMGSVQFTLRNLEGAELAYRKAVELDPGYSDALVNLGSLCLTRARMTGPGPDADRLLAEGIERYRQALAITPNHFDAHLNLGVALQDRGEYDQARQWYERALYLKPNDPKALKNMGSLHLTLGQKAGAAGRPDLLQARQWFLRSLQVQPGFVPARQGLQQTEQLLSTTP